MARPLRPKTPFYRFNSSPEIIRLVVMMYVKFPLSLRDVEDLLHERGIDVCHETVRFWWNRFGPMFAAEIRARRVDRMRAYTHWRWHLDEVYVKINGELRYLWRAVDHEGEVLESFVTKTRDKEAALTFIQEGDEAPQQGEVDHDRWPALLPSGDEADRQPGPAGDRSLGQQPGREFTPAVPTTRARHAQIPEDENTPKVRLGPRLSSQPLQSGASPHQPGTLQGETIRRPRGVAGSHELTTAWVSTPSRRRAEIFQNSSPTGC